MSSSATTSGRLKEGATTKDFAARFDINEGALDYEYQIAVAGWDDGADPGDHPRKVEIGEAGEGGAKRSAERSLGANQFLPHRVQEGLDAHLRALQAARVQRPAIVPSRFETLRECGAGGVGCSTWGGGMGKNTVFSLDGLLMCVPSRVDTVVSRGGGRTSEALDETIGKANELFQGIKELFVSGAISATELYTHRDMMLRRWKGPRPTLNRRVLALGFRRGAGRQAGGARRPSKAEPTCRCSSCSPPCSGWPMTES